MYCSYYSSKFDIRKSSLFLERPQSKYKVTYIDKYKRETNKHAPANNTTTHDQRHTGSDYGGAITLRTGSQQGSDENSRIHVSRSRTMVPHLRPKFPSSRHHIRGNKIRPRTNSTWPAIHHGSTRHSYESS
ncbi:uncharacterized protein LOC112552817 [Pogonomyrmex barbatus]|uniref:Uncharacterized protein LOC112552817 n=1 Tax=Pogonomyrmex barbatus TaxID=144034 RepID=A0A8N1S9P6_9HYME|nr:uncharacterized protein LOC112552817 [Pogonomyrmex barbatus]